MFRKKLAKCIPISWKMKTLASAQTKFEIDKNLVYHLFINHEKLKGVSPNMLLWWFHNIDGYVKVNGNRVPRYRLWHPEDHIRWQLVRPALDGSAGVGAKVRIVEAFGSNPAYHINSVEEVVKLDKTGIKLIRKIFGVTIFSLEHEFLPDEDGTIYRSHMIVGTGHWLMKYLFNRLIRKVIFTRQMGQAWLKHNIEEVGNFEHFLPELYQSANNSTQAEQASHLARTTIDRILFANSLYI